MKFFLMTLIALAASAWFALRMAALSPEDPGQRAPSERPAVVKDVAERG